MPLGSSQCTSRVDVEGRLGSILDTQVKVYPLNPAVEVPSLTIGSTSCAGKPGISCSEDMNSVTYYYYRGMHKKTAHIQS